MNEIFETPKQDYLEIFHAAQARLAAGDLENGKELLAQAAELVDVMGDEQDFSEYIKGTQAYLDKNADLLRGVIGRIQEPTNKAILERFVVLKQIVVNLNSVN
jgi:hypothetical protein